MDYYDYVRARLGGGRLRFDPVREVADMVASNCADLGYRADAVTLSLAGGPAEPAAAGAAAAQHLWHRRRLGDLFHAFARRPAQDRLQGSCATTPSAFWSCGGRAIRAWSMRGSDLAGDMLAAYDRAAAACSIGYVRSDGSQGDASAMRRRGGGCSACPSIPINAWSGAGARRAPSWPAAATARSSARWYDGRAAPAQPDRPHL